MSYISSVSELISKNMYEYAKRFQVYLCKEVKVGSPKCIVHLWIADSF